jgi:death-on-curing protein
MVLLQASVIQDEFLENPQILFIHPRLIEETDRSHGVRDLDMLLSAIGKPRPNFENRDLYPNLFCMVTALLEPLIHNYPFVNSNKPTGA